MTIRSSPTACSRCRDERTKSVDFRRIAREIASFLAYEATRDLPTEPDEVTTPLGLVARGMRPSMPGPLVVPILHAGLGLLDGVLAALPDAEVGVIGLEAGRDARIVRSRISNACPTISPAGTRTSSTRCSRRAVRLATACEMLRAPDAGAITALCLIAAPEGVARVRAADPSVRVFHRRADPQLNEHAFIVPGLGDAGDRLYGAGSA